MSYSQVKKKKVGSFLDRNGSYQRKWLERKKNIRNESR